MKPHPRLPGKVLAFYIVPLAPLKDGAYGTLAGKEKIEELLLSLSSDEDNQWRVDASQDSALLTSLFQVFSTFC